MLSKPSFFRAMPRRVDVGGGVAGVAMVDGMNGRLLGGTHLDVSENIGEPQNGW